MEKRVNYISQLHITVAVYKAMIGLNLSPYETKGIIEAIETGIKSANAYDEEIKREFCFGNNI